MDPTPQQKHVYEQFLSSVRKTGIGESMSKEVEGLVDEYFSPAQEMSRSPVGLATHLVEKVKIPLTDKDKSAVINLLATDLERPFKQHEMAKNFSAKRLALRAIKAIAVFAVIAAVSAMVVIAAKAALPALSAVVAIGVVAEHVLPALSMEALVDLGLGACKRAVGAKLLKDDIRALYYKKTGRGDDASIKGTVRKLLAPKPMPGKKGPGVSR